MVMLWLIIIGVFIVVEIFTSAFYAIFVVCGAIFALLCDVFGGPLALQLVIFAAGSAGTVLSLRKPLLKRFRIPHYKRLISGIDGLVGNVGITTRVIENSIVPGRVRIHGENWMAITYDKIPIKDNQKVTVIAVENGKLVVSVIEEIG